MPVGTLTIISPNVTRTTFGKADALDFDDIKSRAFPPENILLEEKEASELAPQSLQRKLQIAGQQKYWRDGMVAKMTGKSKELHEAFKEALEQRDNSKASYPITQIIFGDHKFLYPIDFASLASAVNTARNGYDVTLIYDIEKKSWDMMPKPLNNPAPKKPKNTLDLG